MNKAKNPSVDYGKSMENIASEMRNPALINKIQDKLLALDGKDALEISVKNMAASNMPKAIEFCYQSHKENPLMLDEMLGKETITDIYEYMGVPPYEIVSSILQLTEDNKKPYEFRKDFPDIKKSAGTLSEEELKQLDEEDSSDPDRRYHR